MLSDTFSDFREQSPCSGPLQAPWLRSRARSRASPEMLLCGAVALGKGSQPHETPRGYGAFRTKQTFTHQYFQTESGVTEMNTYFA